MKLTLKESFKELENKRSEIFEKSPESISNYKDNVVYDSNVSNVDELYNAILDNILHMTMMFDSLAGDSDSLNGRSTFL